MIDPTNQEKNQYGAVIDRGFIYKNGSRNFLTKLKRVNGFGRKIRAGMRIQNSSLFGMIYLREGETN